ncbi:ComEC/Rec2 family competence protein [Photobacterium leiognathi]|uniref:hypothetical protein n=1 Tax=Photobacterium leiognathi TaxID=553611 RepID=UPI0029813C1B|nr:hypothetical protein [Photobacterium leiognathi]
MKADIKRIFHTVGQGAFYSESHEGFNVVYDCGNWKNSRVSTDIVKNAFAKGEVIDILYISHFDYDHVNKIRVLANNCIIKKVIMPLLSDDEKNIITNIYRMLRFNVLNLINKPEIFFGPRTKIIKVRPAGENHVDRKEEPEFINVEDLNSGFVDSGTIIKLSLTKYNWLFIPYNYENAKRRTELENTLVAEGFSHADIYKMKNDPLFTLHEIIKDVSLSKNKGGKVFSKIYSSLSGGINQNSMLLFSGVNDNELKIKQYINYELRNPKKFERNFLYRNFNLTRKGKNIGKVSCIYTGDADLNLIDLDAIFGSYTCLLGTIQLPHHGAKSNFDFSLLTNVHYFLPVSVGLNNTYLHPSNCIIRQAIKKGSTPIFITENESSKFTQEYWIR